MVPAPTAQDYRLRILIDATGAPETSGGMEVWAREIAYAWNKLYPEDEILIVGHRGLINEFLSTTLSVLDFSARNPVARAFVQQLLVPVVFKLGRFEGLISINAVLSPVLWNINSVVLNHDWRHITRPSEFGRTARLYRRLWRVSTRKARYVSAVSSKTAIETAKITGRADVVTTPPGGNHLDRVSPARPSVMFKNTNRFILTFAHHSNKRADLALRAFGGLFQHNLIDKGFRLCILGAKGQRLKFLQKLASSEGVHESTDFIEFVSQSEYKWLISEAAVLLMLSTDEGYGLPVAESLRQGVPVVVSRMSGVAELFPGHVLDVGESLEEIMRGICFALTGPRGRVNSGLTWSQAAHSLRELLARSHSVRQ